MILDQWLPLVLSALFLALLLAACVIWIRRRRRLRAQSRTTWLTDAMVEQIIEVGVLSERQVPEPTLDLEEIAKEEERFWSETWDEPERYWE